MPPRAPMPGNGKAVAALVLGIISIVFCWFAYFNIFTCVCSVVGLILAVSASKEMQFAGIYSGRGIATAGLVLCIIGVALSVLMFFACTLPAIRIARAAHVINDYFSSF